jgi:secondary thiamine-phosphate synthase enzyme
MKWLQHTINLKSYPRGFHLITREVLQQTNGLADFQVGMFQLFIQHTSASLTINENADPDVRIDMETAINQICPETFPFVHTIEGPDDMPAHVKSSLMGSSIQIPIGAGRLLLGTWQGIYLCEHRNRASGRRLIATAWGE